PAQPVFARRGRGVGRVGADESERVDLQPHDVVDPVRFCHVVSSRERSSVMSSPRASARRSCRLLARALVGHARKALAYNAFISSVSSAAGPSTSTPGATVAIGSVATGGAGTPHSRSHWA